MVAVSATELAEHFGRYKQEVLKEPIAITKDGCAGGVFLSLHEYGEYQRLKSYARRVYHISELPEEMAVAIGKSFVDPRHDHLNSWMEED